MKKIALTFVAIAFGTCVGFAQSTPQTDINSTENTVHALVVDRMSNKSQTQAAERRAISEHDLPETVVEQLQYSELAGHIILSVTEVHPEFGNNEPVEYELVLQDRPAQSTTNISLTEPNLLVRFDEYGEKLSQEKVPAAAMANKEK